MTKAMKAMAVLIFGLLAETALAEGGWNLTMVNINQVENYSGGGLILIGDLTGNLKIEERPPFVVNENGRSLAIEGSNPNMSCVTLAAFAKVTNNGVHFQFKPNAKIRRTANGYAVPMSDLTNCGLL